MDDVTRHKDFLSYGDWRVLSWNFLKNVKGKRKKSFSHIQFYTCSILQMVHRSSSFSIGKIKKDPLVSLPSTYRKSTRESSIFCTIRTVESSNRHKLTRISLHRRHKFPRKRNLVKERDNKKKRGREKSGRPKHFLVAKNQEEGWSTPGWWLHEQRRVDRAPLQLFQLSIGHRRKLHVAFPCVTMHAGYNRITLLLCHQEDHYAQPGARRRSERNCIV